MKNRVLRRRDSKGMSKIIFIRIPSVLFVTFLLLLASCASPENPNAVQVNTRLPTKTVAVSPTVTPTEPTPGPFPRSCPVSTPTLHSITPHLGPVIGTSPVWAEWSSGLSLIHLESRKNYPSNYDAPYGWQVLKVIWEVEPHYTHPIAIRGYELSDHTPLLLEFDGPPTANAVLDPHNPTHPVSVVGSGWTEWGSSFVVPKAGCYSMEVSWPTGHWNVTMAFGA
jgi:hypothetical protein